MSGPTQIQSKILKRSCNRNGSRTECEGIVFAIMTVIYSRGQKVNNGLAIMRKTGSGCNVRQQQQQSLSVPSKLG
jgi:hypothetical protein